ncbi:hypothetical protein EHS19_00900 [Bifidobacterium jacchi]|uniref:Uncharacterized protein n=1 Tax=Bifidobacterium jacchi TaxID=2490545 RepID=A0A5N5RMH5_9BIFI|nr:hypothetical protein EHS19_00900 [Bifidobacterium jacchi]
MNSIAAAVTIPSATRRMRLWIGLLVWWLWAELWIWLWFGLPVAAGVDDTAVADVVDVAVVVATACVNA